MQLIHFACGNNAAKRQSANERIDTIEASAIIFLDYIKQF